MSGKKRTLDKDNGKLKLNKIAKKQKLQERGITLIALVVTIIILLILAGVALNIALSDNGLFSKAKKSAEETAKASEEEQRQLTIAEATMNLNGTKYNSTYKGEEVTVPIPAGFAVSQVKGENTVDDGLVIIDSEGNEFVWIPCEFDSTVPNKSSLDPVYYNDSTVESSTNDNRNEQWRDKQYYYNGGTWYDSQPHSDEVVNSIKTHHGFYVARYEAGVPENASFYVSEKSTGEELNYKDTEAEAVKNVTTESGKDLKPVSKKGNQVWNYISQTNAEIVAGNMVNNSDVQSYLIDSHAWNTICRLIRKNNGDSDEKLLDSTAWGNYVDNTTTKYEKLKGLWADHDDGYGNFKRAEKYEITAIPKKTYNKRIELATGISEDFKAYNIYDLAGNMVEWTTEVGKNLNKNSGNPNCKEEGCADPNEIQNAVFRGGGLSNNGTIDPVVAANGFYNANGVFYNVSFRVVLYMK